MNVDNTISILSAITTLKSSLAYFIEPDFGLLDHLLGLQVLTLRQIASVRSERTVYDRNDSVLELLTSENQCVRFLTALQRTGQQHVVYYITQNGGQKHSDDQTVMSSRALHGPDDPRAGLGPNFAKRNQDGPGLKFSGPGCGPRTQGRIQDLPRGGRPWRLASAWSASL